MTIAHLVITGDVGGGQLVALQLARAARAAGHDAFFIAPAPGAFVELAQSEGFTVDIVPLRRSFHLRAAWKLRRALVRGKADILHTHTLAGSAAPARVAARSAGVNVITHAHAVERLRTQRLPRALVRLLDNATVRLTSRVIAVSNDTAQAFIRHGYPPRLVTTIPNGVAIPVDVGRRAPPADLGLDEQARIVLCVGRLSALKGQRDLIEAFASVARAEPLARLVLAGADPAPERPFELLLRRLAKHHGIGDAVVFAGHRNDVDVLLDAADVVVLPSHHEAMPMILLEAMARGRPVVATNVGGVPELVEAGVSGLLVPPGDPRALAHAVATLLQDPERARELAANGRTRAIESFSIENAAARVLAVYADVAV
jgi:glycosyltransferase involved in cell wall biosynthesis